MADLLVSEGKMEKQSSELQFFDCHCHLADKDFEEDLDDVIARAKKVGVAAALVCAISPLDFGRVVQLSESYPDFCLPCLGVHPAQPSESGEVGTYRSAKKEDLEAALPIIHQHSDRILAIGEVGLDFTPKICKSDEEKEIQREVLRKQVEVAKQLDLPLNVHSRSAGRPTIHLLKECGATRVLLHAFDGRPAVAMEGVAAGFFFSIPPSIVRSQQKEKLVDRLPLENIILETDSPALGPEKQVRNEPANILTSCEYIAKIKKMEVAEVAKIARENTLRLFPALSKYVRR